LGVVALAKRPHRGWLRVVDEDEIVLLLELVGGERVAPQVGLPGPLAQMVVGALECVVEVLGDTWKKRSSAEITFQSAAIPRPRKSATSERSSSATPPPYGVAFRCKSRAPFSGRASSATSSSSAWSTRSR